MITKEQIDERLQEFFDKLNIKDTGFLIEVIKEERQKAQDNYEDYIINAFLNLDMATYEGAKSLLKSRNHFLNGLHAIRDNERQKAQDEILDIIKELRLPHAGFIILKIQEELRNRKEKKE
jgi:hypothetical protein